MDNETKDAIAQRIAERVAGQNLSQEQVETLTAKVMEKASEVAPTPAAETATPVEPTFAANLFQTYQVGASLAPTGHGNTLVNARPAQDYQKTYDQRLRQTSQTSDQMQASAQPVKTDVRQVSYTPEQMEAEFAKKK